jgi:peptidoglycan hydrolase-like protein with peptidoglycan-binding domain
MANKATTQQIDQLAAEQAAQVEQESPVDYGDETTLAFGATGECVQRLVNLLASLGYTTNKVIKGGSPVLDETVLADVSKAQNVLGVSEPELTTPDLIPVGVKGTIVGAPTWAALYSAAEAKLSPPASDASPPAASDGQASA